MKRFWSVGTFEHRDALSELLRPESYVAIQVIGPLGNFCGPVAVWARLQNRLFAFCKFNTVSFLVLALTVSVTYNVTSHVKKTTHIRYRSYAQFRSSFSSRVRVSS